MTDPPTVRRAGRRLLLLAAALSAGCAGDVDRARQLEATGRPQAAYEAYRRAVTSNPDNGAAAAGMRRTAPPAAAYWQRQADAAAEAGDWQQAAECHLEALRIKPNEVTSILTLRGIARKQPAVYAAAVSAPPLTAGEEAPASAPVLATGGATAAATQPTLAAATQPALARIEPPESTSKPSPGAQERPTTAIAATGPPTASRERPPKRTGPPPVPSRPVRPPSPPPRPRRPAPAGPFLLVTKLSRDDDRYPKQTALREGLSLKLKDTDHGPLDADVEVYLGGKRLGGKLKDLPPGSVIVVSGWTGRRYQIVLLEIDDDTETITIGLRQERWSPRPG